VAGAEDGGVVTPAEVVQLALKHRLKRLRVGTVEVEIGDQSIGTMDLKSARAVKPLKALTPEQEAEEIRFWSAAPVEAPSKP
jgi:hypothetical protein